MIRKLFDNYKYMLVYILLAALIGLVVGTIDTIFGRVLIEVSKIRDGHIFWFLPFLPVAGVLITLMYRQFSRESLKGMSLVFETGFGRSERIPKMLIPLAMLSTWITHFFGGSAGREGVAVQLGATVGHTVGRKFNLPDNSRIMLITGMAAGFAGLFQTPFTATFFAIEVLVAGALQYEALLPALTAALTASWTSHMLGLEKFSLLVEAPEGISVFSGSMILRLAILGVIFGLTGGAFAHLLTAFKKYAQERIADPIKRIIIMGILAAGLLMLLGAGRYSGLGTNLINAGFSGGTIHSYDWLLKILLTILTLSAGYQGGEVTPLFSIGASLGVVMAGLLGLPVTFAAALGYASVFGSATNTLIAPILIGVEVFGGGNMLSFVLVCAIAYAFNGNRTIYSGQKKEKVQ